MNRRTGVGRVTLLLALAGWPAQAVAQDVATVTPPVEIDAASFVPQALIQGKNHQVAPQASNDGFVNHYKLETEWGEVDAVSDYQLRARIQEANALKTLDEMSRAGVFGDALVDGALAPVNMVVDLVTDPADTVSGAVEGVGKWFGNIAKSVGSEDPHQEGALSSAAGWAGTKRAFAVELGVDPYTDWEPLQEGLASVGRAAFAGGITASAAVGAATEGTAIATPITVLNISDTGRKMLIDNPPERLADAHRADLKALGVPDDVIEPFLQNYNYSPMEKLLLVEALKRMDGAGGLDIYVAHATAAPDKRVARYMQQRAEMMANFHELVAPLSIVRTSETPLQQTGDGRIVGLFPLDYVPWTPDLATIMTAMTPEIDQLDGVTSKEMWIEGQVSPDTRQAMEAMGWTVKDRAGLLIADG